MDPGYEQCAKKCMSTIRGLVDFSVGLVNFIHHLPNGQIMFSDFWFSNN